MRISRFEQLFRPRLFEFRQRLILNLAAEYPYDRTMIQKHLAQLASRTSLGQSAYQTEDWHLMTAIRMEISEMVKQVLRQVSRRDFSHVVCPLTEKVWKFFTRNLFGRGSSAKAEAVARVLLYETSRFLKSAPLDHEEKFKVVNYYSQACALDQLVDTIFCDELEKSLFKVFRQFGIKSNRKSINESGLADESWLLYRHLLRKYRSDVCALGSITDSQSAHQRGHYVADR